MSILLEALRKSEKSEHPQSVPTIHEDPPGDPSGDGLPLGPAAVLLLAALVVCGWFIWNQYRAGGETSIAPPVQAIAGKDVAQNTDIASPATPSQRPSVTAARNAGQDTARPRTPVEAYQPSTEADGSSASQGPDGTSPVPGADGGSPTHSAGGQSSESRNWSSGSRSPQPVPGGSASEQEPKSGEPDRPAIPAPIGYWELPDSIREVVPEIKFSVLVYAADPADRFVLVNGQRLLEGDSLQPGLEVEEIRRDGVVFSYRLYRFLVER